MPRYFFDIMGDDPLVDVDGDILDDLPAARKAAVEIVGQILPIRSLELFANGELGLHVRDVEDRIVYRLEIRSRSGS